MIRLFYAAVVALLLAMSVEFTVAVPLSPTYSDAASSPRFQSSADANVSRATAPASPTRADMSTRCKELAASMHAATASPDRHVEVSTATVDGQRIVDQVVRDKRADLEGAYQEAGCPRN